MIIFSAPSGSGKSTIINQLLDKGLGLEFSISATTRGPRGAETHGKEYYFLDVNDFLERIERGEFVEYEQVYEGRYYGTLRSELERIWSKGNTVVFDVDVVGGVKLKGIFGDHALSMFIKPPSVEELRKRLRGRQTDDETEIEKRVAKAELELSYANRFDVEVVNDVLQDAVRRAELQIREFLERE